MIPKPDWRRRWALIRAVLAFCAGLVAWITLFGADDRLRETALLGAFGLAGAVALGYLGFATQDDHNWLRALPPGLGAGAGP
jgi:CHASE2 domain-containing sensor protein